MYNNSQRQILLQLAKDSILSGLQQSGPLSINLQDYEADLQLHRACFVTLHKNAQLRGCIGSLEARRPLVQDVTENAYAAAFRDPRFSGLKTQEFDFISISISVLTAATQMLFNSEQDLLKQIRPGIDGLILQEGHHRGTFLPSVWEQLPDPVEFLQHLKLKAGLSSVDYWSKSIQISRYETETIE